MEENIKRIKYILEFGKKTGIQYVLETDDEKALNNILNELERLQKEFKAVDNECSRLEKKEIKLENALKNKKTVHTCLHCGENTPLYCEKCQQELITKNAELQLENEELRKEVNEENKRCMLLAIEKQDLIENSIPKQVIRDKFKRINETKIKINKTNARDYMIFGNTERATGWFINIDYIEKILLDVPGYKIGDE